MKSVEWSMSVKQLAAFEKRLERYQGLPMQRRIQRGTLASAQYLARPMRAGAPVRTGRLKKSIKARQLKARAGTSRYSTMAAMAGPTSPVRHLVIRGHRIVTRSGHDTGRRSKANPFVDRAIANHLDEAMRIVTAALFGN